MELLCPVSPPPAFSLFLPLASACLGAALLLGKPVAHLHNNWWDRKWCSSLQIIHGSYLPKKCCVICTKLQWPGAADASGVVQCITGAAVHGGQVWAISFIPVTWMLLVLPFLNPDQIFSWNMTPARPAAFWTFPFKKALEHLKCNICKIRLLLFSPSLLFLKYRSHLRLCVCVCVCVYKNIRSLESSPYNSWILWSSFYPPPHKHTPYFDFHLLSSGAQALGVIS